jgi:hypothetical protein
VPKQRSRERRLDLSQETFRGRARRISRHVALALLFAAPLLFVAITAHNRGFVSPGNQWIVHRGEIATSGPGLSKLQYLYPPLPVLLSIVVPGGVFGLAICTCLFSGLMASFLVRRIGLLKALVLGLPLTFVPEMWFVSSELIAPVLALTFLAIALFGFIEFASRGETYGGFIAGLALAASYAADPGALLYAAVMCLFVPLLGSARFNGDPQGPIGASAVIAFPVVAMALCWSFLIWKFSGTWPGDLKYSPTADVFGFPYGVLGGLGHALVTTLGDLARSVLYITAGVLLCLRRRTILVGLGLLLPVIALAVALWLGFAYSSVTAYYLFVLLAITVIIDHKLIDRQEFAAVLAIAAVVQVIVANLWLPPTAGYTVWHHLMFQ